MALNTLRNNRGSLLMTTMIFVGTVAVILGLAVKMSLNSSQDRANESKSAQLDIVIGAVRAALVQQTQCGQVFGGITYAGEARPVPSVTVVKGNPIAVGTAVGPGLQVSEISLVPIVGKGSRELSDGSRVHFANLHFEYAGGSSWISRKKQIDVPLRIVVNPAKQIISCGDEAFYTAIEQADNICYNTNLKHRATPVILGATFDAYYIVYNRDSGLRYYCVIPRGSDAGFLTACFDGRCMWN
ncbi:MAG: hypothetical protein J7501_13905 [Bdellovibrio sp.]|nr:hypothetical protein [Bdellovibrio sp.]